MTVALYRITFAIVLAVVTWGNAGQHRAYATSPIDDEFNDNFLNPSLWLPFSSIPASTVTQTNQRLEISLPAGGPGGAGIISTCSIGGDFDAQVDYALVNWPPMNAYGLSLSALDLGGRIFRNSGGSATSFEFYSVSAGGSFSQVTTTHTSGKIRLVRSGSTLSGFFLSGATWTLVGSGNVSTAATRFSLGVGPNISAPGGIEVAFDNFRVNAGTIQCPETPSSPVLSVTPSSLDFLTVTVGASKDLTFTVQNTGGGTLTGSATASAPFSIVGSNSFNLAANQSPLITVRFSPTAAVSSNAFVNFTSNGGNAAVAVTGSAFATPILTRFSVADLGDIPGGSDLSIAHAISNLGTVVGESIGTADADYTQCGAGGGALKPFIWTPAVGIQTLGPTPTLNIFTNPLKPCGGGALGTNDQGAVVGYLDYGFAGGTRGFIWSAGNGMQLIDPQRSQGATDINNGGQVVGPTGGGAYRWSEAGGFEGLDGSGTVPWASAINNLGIAAGVLQAGRYSPVFWDAAGTLRLMNGIPDDNLGSETRSLMGINDLGEIVGRVCNSLTSLLFRADGCDGFFWSPVAGAQNLGELTTLGSHHTGGFGINSSSQIVGSSNGRAFLWTVADGIQDLNSLLDQSGAGWTLISANAINDSGQIVGYGDHNGANRAFLLNPVASTPNPVVLQPGPGQSKDIWTTSVFSYAPSGGGPGGGQDDHKLVVGGWGDLYYSLLQFDIRNMPAKATSARLEMFSFTQRGVGTTGLYLDRITEFWDWKTQGTGGDRERLWWADRPAAVQWRLNALPAPSIGTWYSIDITDLYNAWQNGTYPNFGVQLRPVRNDNYWAEFYSSDYVGDPSLRPRLIVLPDDSVSVVPSLAVNPSSLDFGTVNVGAVKDMTFAVQNTGGGTLAGSATASAPFSIVGSNSFNLAANQSALITVRFSPTTAVSSNAFVNFISNAGNAALAVTGAGVLADTDGDGMPDVWEILYGFNPNDPNDAVQDADGDGLTNLQEFQRGSDPKVSNVGGNQPLSGQLSSLDPINVNLPTVIITHGWQPGITSQDLVWPRNMAEEVKARLVREKKCTPGTTCANILTFTWPDAFTDRELPLGFFEGDFIEPVPFIETEGAILYLKLKSQLGENYSKPLHFIGHSYGALVNAFAVKLLTQMTSTQVDQFTILDVPLRFTPFDESIFHNWLPAYPQVKWVDNYVGTKFFDIPPSFGQPIEGAAKEIVTINCDILIGPIFATLDDCGGKAHPAFFRAYNHTTIVDDYYLKTITNESQFPQEGFWQSILLGDRQRQNLWQPPPPSLTSQILDRLPDVFDLISDFKQGFNNLGNGFYDVGKLYLDGLIDLGGTIQNAWEKNKGTVGQVIQKTGTTVSSFISLFDLSDSAITRTVTIPTNASLLKFDVFFANKGDGDWVTLHFNDILLWSFSGDAFPSSTDSMQSSVPIRDLVGQTGRLMFTLHGINGKNAVVYLGNFQFIETGLNASPVASAGVNQTVRLGSLVTLNGSASSDPDNGPGPLSYSWTRASGPTVTLTGGTTAKPSFRPTVPGTYVFNLIVNDGLNNSVAASVTITVPILGDIDVDGDVDVDDLHRVNSAMNTNANGPNDLRDLNGDGRIDGKDVAELAKRCTRPGCGPPSKSRP